MFDEIFSLLIIAVSLGVVIFYALGALCALFLYLIEWKKREVEG